MLLKELVFRLAKRKVCTGQGKTNNSAEEVQNWRESVFRTEFLQRFDEKMFQGKDVLDFGCGTGGLALMLAQLGAKSCVGIDLTPRDIETANSLVTTEPVSFLCASSTKTIDMNNNSVDIIACFDVMEHIMEYENIISEWHRILRPGGRVLIHWQPWFHPYAHHSYAYIPLPWVHVFLNNRELTEICARMVEEPEFPVPFWDYDEHGQKINRFKAVLESGQADKSDYLNELTMLRFERLCQAVGLKMDDRTLLAIQGPLPVRTTSWLLSKIPGVREFFTAIAIYTWSK